MNLPFKKTLSIITLSLCLATTLTACNRAVEVPYTEVSNGTTKEELVEQLDGKADKKKEEDGLVSYSYSKSKYLDYEGTMTYYLTEDVVAFSRWEYEAENEEEGKKVFDTIFADLKKKYKDGNETTDATGSTIVWNTDDKNITLVYTNTEELGYKVAITSIDASAGGTGIAATEEPKETDQPTKKKTEEKKTKK